MKEYKNDDGLLHRVNAPAVMWANGDGFMWFYNGSFHRYYGPARLQNGCLDYWIFDEYVK